MADYKQVVSFIQELEGGLSKATTDSASKNCVSGCLGTKNGVTSTDWHTNKGVTWCTFNSWADKHNIDKSKRCKMFIDMDADTWNGVFKELFWDKINGDAISSQAVAEYWANARWGNPSTANTLLRDALRKAGVKIDSTDANDLTQAVNSLAAKGVKNEKALFVDFVNGRKAWLRTLSGAKTNVGWFSRQDKFMDRGLSLLKTKEIQERVSHGVGPLNSGYKGFRNASGTGVNAIGTTQSISKAITVAAIIGAAVGLGYYLLYKNSNNKNKD